MLNENDRAGTPCPLNGANSYHSIHPPPYNGGDGSAQLANYNNHYYQRFHNEHHLPSINGSMSNWHSTIMSPAQDWINGGGGGPTSGQPMHHYRKRNSINEMVSKSKNARSSSQPNSGVITKYFQKNVVSLYF